MKKFALLFVLLFLFGCGSARQEVTLADDGQWLSKDTEWVRVKLRVYPPYRWKHSKCSWKFEDDGSIQPLRVKGEVPGDPEYDVFIVPKPTSRQPSFYLVDKDGKYVRSFAFYFYR